jgi:hypothetical protein
MVRGGRAGCRLRPAPPVQSWACRVDSQGRGLPQLRRRGYRPGRTPPACGGVPAGLGRVEPQVVTDRAACRLRRPLVPPIADRARQPVAAVRPIGQMRQRAGSFGSSHCWSGWTPMVLLPTTCRPRRRRSGTGVRPASAPATPPWSAARPHGPWRGAASQAAATRHPTPARPPAAPRPGRAGPPAAGGGPAFGTARLGWHSRAPAHADRRPARQARPQPPDRTA